MGTTAADELVVLIELHQGELGVSGLLGLLGDESVDAAFGVVADGAHGAAAVHYKGDVGEVVAHGGSGVGVGGEGPDLQARDKASLPPHRSVGALPSAMGRRAGERNADSCQTEGCVGCVAPTRRGPGSPSAGVSVPRS